MKELAGDLVVVGLDQGMNIIGWVVLNWEENKATICRMWALTNALL